MRIDSMTNSFQPQEKAQQVQAVKQSGTESKPIEKASAENTNKKNTEIMNAEANLSAEQRSQQKEQEVIRAIEKANKNFRTFDRRLEFSIHDTTKQILVKVINTNDDSVIREIPSEKVLDMVAHMWEVAGILVDEKR